MFTNDDQCIICCILMYYMKWFIYYFEIQLSNFSDYNKKIGLGLVVQYILAATTSGHT